MIQTAQTNYIYGVVALVAILGLTDLGPGLLSNLLSTDGLIPQGRCYLLKPELIGLHVSSDLLIGIAYFVIAGTLAYLLYKTWQEIPFHWMFAAFGTFILLCGMTHVMEVITLWQPVYWLSGNIKLLTAAVSLTTALALPPLVPQVHGLLRSAKTCEEHRQKLEMANQELKILYQRVKELDRTKTEFFANASHELRTPLALILGPIEKLLSSNNLNRNQRHSLEVIDRNARSLLSQVNDWLDLSRLEFGKMDVNYQDGDLTQLVRLTTAHFETLAEDRQINFVVETPPSLFAQVDPEKLQRVFLNLLSNAFKFTPDGGEIRCQLQEILLESDDLGCADPKQAVFTIQDSGPGVPPELRDTIFEHFCSKPVANAPQSGGIGLGLAIAKELVELHQGSIYVTDAATGGACFQVTVPLRTPHTAKGRPHFHTHVTEMLVPPLLSGTPNRWVPLNQPSLISFSKKIPLGQENSDSQKLEATVLNHYPLRMTWLRPQSLPKDPTSDAISQTSGPPAPTPQDPEKALVLIIEDDREMNWFISQILAEQYRIANAFDGQEGLERAIALQPDLIVSDVMMPNLDGEQLVQHLRQHRDLQNIPLILLAARTDREFKVSLLRHGAQDYLTKPFSTAELQARVENLITMHRARRVLQTELESQSQDIATLVSELSQRKQELQATAEELARNNRMKDEFLAMLSHELRTPLNPILGWTKLLQTRRFCPETTRRALETIERNARLQSQLVNDLLEVSRITQGKIRLQTRKIDLVLVLESALEAVHLGAEAKAIAINLEIVGSELSEGRLNRENYASKSSAVQPHFGNLQSTICKPQFLLMGDPDRLQQVLWNLLSNAIKFTPEGGQIDVKLSLVAGHPSEGDTTPTFSIDTPSPRTHYAQITVTDTGMGIHPDFLPHVFDHFQQADSSLSRMHGGLGLGLAIVRHLVEIHGGSVQADSAGEEQGATFTVWLPLIDEVNEEIEEKFEELMDSEPLLSLSGLRVLVIDNDADTRDYLSAALNLYRMEVVVAANAREGLQLIIQAAQASSLPDIIVSDTELPDKTGHALLRQIRELDFCNMQQIPAIALTAGATEKEADQAKLAGFQLHLPKPVEPRQIVAAIASLTRRGKERSRL
jgi:signal transduction histidine kinase